MTASASDAAQAATRPPEAQAAALWTFVQLRTPRLSSADALSVVRELAPASGEDVKTVAKRLRGLLLSRGIALKHTHALDAAARLLGHQNWHAASRDAVPTPLELVCAYSALNRTVRNWEEGVQVLSDCCEGVWVGGGLRVYHIGFTPTSVSFDTPLSTCHDADGRVLPYAQLRWKGDHGDQLAAAINGIETLRRRYEETGKGIVDGLAAAQFCLQNPHFDAHADDPANSELVAIDAKPGPGFGDEVARGDEAKCWSELEFLHPKDTAPSYSLDDAIWAIGQSRYQWRLSTVRYAGVVPTVVSRPLTDAESARLFRRHQLALRHGYNLAREDRVKALSSVSIEREGIDVDWHKVRDEAIGIGRGSSELEEAYVRLSKRARLTVEEVVRLAAMLGIRNPAELARKPKRSELQLLRTDELVRALVSRVQDVTFEVPRRMPDEMLKDVDDAVTGLLTALKHDVVFADGEVRHAFPRTPPYMVYANQGKELLARLKDLGLVAYAGVYNTVSPASGFANRKNATKMKVERVLFLDIDFAEVA